MGLKYLCLYYDTLHATETLNDAQFGRLVRAMLRYAQFEEAPVLKGKEAVLFPSFSLAIDRDKEAYEKKCERNRINGGKRTQATATQYKDKEKDEYDDKHLRAPDLARKRRKKKNPEVSSLPDDPFDIEGRIRELLGEE